MATILFEELTREIVKVTLNRPERCNAFSSELLARLHDLLDEIAVNTQYHVVLLCGAGKAFCGGLDLSEATNTQSDGDWPDSHPHEMAMMVAAVLVKLRRLPQIVIASVHGSACGGGAAMVAASDLVVAAEGFKMAFPEVRRGLEPTLLFPLLRRKLPDFALRQMLLTGLPIDASRAKEFGLVHYVVKPDELENMTRLLAEEVCAGEPHAVRFAKRMLQSSVTPSDVDRFENEMRDAVEQHIQSWRSTSAQEGIAAFLEKRQPNWNSLT